MSPYIWVAIVIGAVILVGLIVGLGVWGGLRKKNNTLPSGKSVYYVESGAEGQTGTTKSCYFVFDNALKTQTAVAPDNSGVGWRETMAPPKVANPQLWPLVKVIGVPDWAGKAPGYAIVDGNIGGDPERRINYLQSGQRRWMRVLVGNCHV